MIQRCTGVDEGLRDQTPLNYGHVSCLLLRQRTARPSVPVEIAEVDTSECIAGTTVASSELICKKMCNAGIGSRVWWQGVCSFPERS